MLRYTGEDGKSWPSTAGPGRGAARQSQGAPAPAGAGNTDSANNSPANTGEPTVNTNPGPARLASPSSEEGWADAVAEARSLAGATLRKTVKLGRKAKRGEKVTLTIRTAGGSLVSRGRRPRPRPARPS